MYEETIDVVVFADSMMVYTGSDAFWRDSSDVSKCTELAVNAINEKHEQVFGKVKL